MKDKVYTLLIRMGINPWSIKELFPTENLKEMERLNIQIKIPTLESFLKE